MAAQANTPQNPRHIGRTLKARLVDVGLYALANDHIQMVHAVTTIPRRRGLRHV
jgi:hypothetical protein